MTRAQQYALLRKLEGPVRAAFEAALKAARGRASINALAAAIEAGDLDAMMKAAGMRDGMWTQLTEQIRSAYAEAGLTAAAGLPRALGTDFNINNPRAEAWLRANAATRAVELKASQRAALQALLEFGMSQGLNPRTTAINIAGRVGPAGRRVGGAIGLTEHQAKSVTLLAQELSDPPSWPAYSKRKLRDKRYDKMVKSAWKEKRSIPAAKRAEIVGKYEDRLIKHRADTIARTETLKAINAAADETMEQVIEEGLVPRHAVVRIWRHSFSANEREGHRAMDGQRRGMNELFVNPLTGIALERPGQGPASEVINCRCVVVHEVDFVAAERAA